MNDIWHVQMLYASQYKENKVMSWKTTLPDSSLKSWSFYTTGLSESFSCQATSKYLVEFSVKGLVSIIKCYMSGRPLLSAISGHLSILYFHLKDCAHPSL